MIITNLRPGVPGAAPKVTLQAFSGRVAIEAAAPTPGPVIIPRAAAVVPIGEAAARLTRAARVAIRPIAEPAGRLPPRTRFRKTTKAAPLIPGAPGAPRPVHRDQLIGIRAGSFKSRRGSRAKKSRAYARTSEAKTRSRSSKTNIHSREWESATSTARLPYTVSRPG